MQKLKRVLVKVGVILLLILAIGIILRLIWLNYVVERNRKMLEPFSTQLNIEPTWEALDQYIKETFVEGMPREEVLKRLERFDDFKISPPYSESQYGFCESVELSAGEGRNVQYIFCYFEDSTLKYVTYSS